MKCPECVESGQRSKVYDRGQARTCLGGSGRFWDEEGVLHSHDPNTTKTVYECSNKHSWAVKSKTPCPNDDCMYGKAVPSCCGGGPQWGHAWGCSK